jgi:putative addiction module component (TIGR02574 family)
MFLPPIPLPDSNALRLRYGLGRYGIAAGRAYVDAGAGVRSSLGTLSSLAGLAVMSTMSFDDVFGAAQGLPVPDRVRLMDALWDTLPPDQWPGPSEEWIAEAQRRSIELDAGRMPTSPWSEVKARARRRAGLDD